MLPWFRKSLSRKAEEKTLRVSPGNTQERPLFIRDSDGFYLPQAADVLLTTPQRQNWLQQISRVVALPDNQYRALCLSPLQTLAERLQCVPASKTGKYAGEGGIAGFNAEYDSLVYADVPERDAAPRASVGRAEPSVQRLECVCFLYRTVLLVTVNGTV
ncbi:TraI domain-containing protein [Providencia stuartii]|nr:TraI domain-containing protein [Providencia stuartii]